MPISWNEYLLDAIEANEVAHVQAALDNGADPNAHEHMMGWMPLCYASGKPSLEIAKILLAHGATVASEKGINHNSVIAAVENNDLPMVDLLLEAAYCIT